MIQHVYFYINYIQIFYNIYHLLIFFTITIIFLFICWHTCINYNNHISIILSSFITFKSLFNLILYALLLSSNYTL